MTEFQINDLVRSKATGRLCRVVAVRELDIKVEGLTPWYDKGAFTLERSADDRIQPGALVRRIGRTRDGIVQGSLYLVCTTRPGFGTLTVKGLPGSFMASSFEFVERDEAASAVRKFVGWSRDGGKSYTGSDTVAAGWILNGSDKVERVYLAA